MANENIRENEAGVKKPKLSSKLASIGQAERERRRDASHEPTKTGDVHGNSISNTKKKWDPDEMQRKMRGEATENLPESEENNENSELDEAAGKKKEAGGLYGRLLKASKKNVAEYKKSQKKPVAESLERPTMDQIIDFAVNKDAVGFSNAIKTELDYRIDERLNVERSEIAKNLARNIQESYKDYDNTDFSVDHADTEDLKSSELADARKHEREQAAKAKAAKKTEKK